MQSARSSSSQGGGGLGGSFFGAGNPLLSSESLEQSLLEWLQTFEIESAPRGLADLFSGEALYEALNRVDPLFWPRSRLVRGANNLRQVVAGLERFCQERLEVIVNGQTAALDLEELVERRDLAGLLEVLELVMGVVVSCEDKQQYIARIMELEPRAQEDLQALIERAFARLRMDIAVADPSAASENPSFALANLKRIESLERDKSELLAQFEQLELQLKEARARLEEREDRVRQLELELAALPAQGGGSQLDGLMHGIDGLSELEAQIQFKDRQLDLLHRQMQEEAAKAKLQKRQLKEELELNKEQLLKLQRAQIENDMYKQMGEDNLKLKARVQELEKQSLQQKAELKALEQERKDSLTVKALCQSMKEDLLKVKAEFHGQTLEFDRLQGLHADLEAQRAKIAHKYDALKEKHDQAQQALAKCQTELKVFRKMKGQGAGLSELDEELNKGGAEITSEEVEELRRQVEELARENEVLRQAGGNELAAEVLRLEHKAAEAEAERAALEKRLGLKEQRLKQLQGELEAARGEAEQESDRLEYSHDLRRENERLRGENEQVFREIEQVSQKMAKRGQQVKELKAEKARLEEELRRLHKEKAEEREQYLRLTEEKIKTLADKVDLESKLQALLKDNQALEGTLRDLQDGKLGASGDQEMSVRILQVEKERDQLKFAQERAELENRLQEYRALLQSKEVEFSMKARQLEQACQDELASVDEAQADQIHALKQQVLQEKKANQFLQRRYLEQDVEASAHLADVGAMFYNLGHEHLKAQEAGRVQGPGGSWLTRQRNNAYTIKYNQIFSPN